MYEPFTPSSPGRRVGRYALFDEIASGGMAAVHFGRLVSQEGFSRTVAIKRLHAQFAKDPEFIAMFLDEARLVARIRHPNVVPTLDIVREGTELLIVMEYVQGETLARLLRGLRSQHEASPLPVVATVLTGVLHGLHAAHEAKGETGEPLRIVHRDVSPQNVLVGTDGVPRILDFGVAKATQRSQSTREGQLKGKLGYMAPEQIMSDTIDCRCDVFAAGVVLWEALAGKRLFEGESDARVVQKILHDDVAAPGRSESLDAICLRALARDPSVRFQTARDMAMAIEKASPMAPASEVGAWVEGLAHDVIAARAARVAEVESSSPALVKPITPDTNEKLTTVAPLPGGTPTRKRKLLVGVGAATASVVLGGLAIAAMSSRSTPESPPPSANSTASSPPAHVDSLPAAAAAAPSATAPEPPATGAPELPHPSTAVPMAAARPAPTKTPLRPASPTKPRGADCSQPFDIDKNGIKHVKAECL